MPAPKIIIAVVFTTFCIAVTMLLYARASSVDRMLGSKNYTVTVNSCGCFGCMGSTLRVFNGRAKYFYGESNLAKNVYDDTTGSFAWDAAKEQQLREFFTAGIKNKNQGLCTTQTTYTLNASPFSVSFTNRHCSNLELFDSLVHPKYIK